MRRAVAIGYQPAVAEVADLLAEHDRLVALMAAIRAASSCSDPAKALQRVRDLAQRGTGGKL